jgi:hypothetical protein
MDTRVNQVSEEYRGDIEGRIFFSRSPFQSGYFLVASAVCFGCVILDVFILYRNWLYLSMGTAACLTLVGIGVASAWLRMYQRLGQIGELYISFYTVNGKPETHVDIMLGLAASMALDSIFFSVSTIVLLLGILQICLSHRPLR